MATTTLRVGRALGGLPLGGRVWEYLRENYLVLLIAGLLLWVVGGPILFLLNLSVHNGDPVRPGDLTLANYAAVYTSPYTYATIVNTVVYAGGVTVIGVVLAAVFAWLIERTDLPGRNLAWTLMLLPMAMPAMLSSMGWVLLLSPRNGLINLPIRALLGQFGIHLDEGPFNPYGLPGMIFVEGIRGSTTLFLMLVTAFRFMDPALEEAALSSGTGPFRTFRKVTLPLMLPALLAASMYAILGNLEDFDIPLLLGMPAGVLVLPTLIFFTAWVSPSPNWGLAAAYTSIFLVIAVGLVAIYHRLVIRQSRRFQTITGKGFRPRRMPLGRWRYAGLALFGIYFMLAVGLPFLVLLWASILPIYQVPSPALLGRLTLENYATLFADPIMVRATFNTIKLAVVTATATMALAYLVSWLVVRLRVRGGAFLDAISFIPHAIPAVAIGLALIVFYLHPALRWLGIYGTMTIMVLALSTRYLAYGTRTSNAAMSQVSGELEEAAWLSGAGKLRTLLKVTTPLLMPAFLAGWLWVAAHAFRTLTIPMLLTTPGNDLIVTRLYFFWDTRANYPQAAALGVVLIVGLGLLIYISRRLIARGYTGD